MIHLTSLKKTTLLLFLIFTSLVSTTSRASTLSEINGIGIPSQSSIKSPTVAVGGDYTFTLSPVVEMGGFFDQTFLRYTNGLNGSIRFYGALLRVHFPRLESLYFDLKVGPTQRSENDTTSKFGLGAGVGVGYRIPIGNHFDLGPRIGVRYLPKPSTSPSSATTPSADFQTSEAGAMLDIGVMVSFHF